MSFGGFLGIGHDDYPLPWPKLTYDERLVGYRTDVTKEQVDGARGYRVGDEFDWSPDSARRVHDYYGVSRRISEASSPAMAAHAVGRPSIVENLLQQSWVKCPRLPGRCCLSLSFFYLGSPRAAGPKTVGDFTPNYLHMKGARASALIMRPAEASVQDPVSGPPPWDGLQCFCSMRMQFRSCEPSRSERPRNRNARARADPERP